MQETVQLYGTGIEELDSHMYKGHKGHEAHNSFVGFEHAGSLRF